MDEETAFEVEAALMDAYPGLTNIAGGIGSSEYGAMHAKEIIRRYAAEPAVFQHKAMLISVNRSAADTSLYEATRFAWKISPSKARQAEVILATLQGLIVGAFVAHDWLEAASTNFPGREDVPGRFALSGKKLPFRSRTCMSANASLMSTASRDLQIPSSTPGASSCGSRGEKLPEGAERREQV